MNCTYVQTYDSTGYFSPACQVLSFVTEGAVLSGSSSFSVDMNEGFGKEIDDNASWF